MIPDEPTQSTAETPLVPPDVPQPLDNPSKSSAEAVVAIFNTLQPYDDATRQKILASVMALLGIPPTSTQTISASGSATTAYPRRPLSPAELVMAKEPATNSQRIIVFAYYREKYENLNYFARDDLKSYFSK